MPKPTLRRFTVNTFIVAIVALITVDCFPTLGQPHHNARAAIDPAMDLLGIWQGEWTLFAPLPKSDNFWLEADITYVDGSTSRWQSPDWSTMSPAEKFVKFRHLNYYSRISRSGLETEIPDLADYLARTVRSPNGADVPALSIIINGHTTCCIPPPPGEIPTADNLVWISNSQELYSKSYDHE